MTTTVAIVEDDLTVRTILRKWIDEDERFCCVGAADSGEEAIERLPLWKPDMVLMDINLPGCSGIESLRVLRDALPLTQFMMVTVYDDADSIFEALSAGAVGYLLKRASREELIEALIEIESGGSPMSLDIARKVVQSFQKTSFLPAGPELTLSHRELEVLRMLAEGYLYKEIADALAVALPTIKTYSRRIYQKLQVHSRSQAVALFERSRRK
jgi:DNA-binding NarL/FixJ family response regulator